MSEATRPSPKECLHAALWLTRHVAGRYGTEELSAICHLIQASDICVDIGAHAGSWTRPLAKLVPHGHVYAFEALPHYARTLSLLVRLLRLSNVTVFNHAITDRQSEVEIAWRTRQGQRLTGNSHVATASELADVDCVSVRAVTLDGWAGVLPASTRIGLVKIDVEGAELMVVRGAKWLLETYRPPVFVEIVTTCCERYGYRPADLFRFFEDLGYRAYTITGQASLTPTTPEGYSGKGDVLFAPLDRYAPSTAAIAHGRRLKAAAS